MKPKDSKYHSKSGFKIPSNYLESFEDGMMTRLRNEELSRLPQSERSFKVPEGYFDNLEDNILSKTNSTDKPVKRLWRKEYLLYAAAIAAIIFLLNGSLFQPKTIDTVGWEDLEVSAMENYIDEAYYEMSSMEFSELIAEDGELVDETDFKRINSQAAMDYLEVNMDNSDLIFE